MRKTKIVCTLGPSTEKDEILKQLIVEGMDVARFNFSHGDHQQHENNLKRVKQFRKELKKPVAALLDTKGPEIRIGTIKKGQITLVAGQTFTLTSDSVDGDEEKVSVSYQNLAKDVVPQNKILLDDGLIELKVMQVTDTDVICTVLNGGTLSGRKGVNIPGVSIRMPYISKQDYEDIVFGVQQEFDFIAASFTRCAQDILEIRKILREYHCNHINIIAKIENMQGVEHIDEIIRVSDGIMIARGDMGVEIPLEQVPVIQKKMIKKVLAAEKPVITATQMLDSMMKNPRPTRAEATDVANAIYDGTSAIMLSGETAAGSYPVESLKTMVRIAVCAEEDINYEREFRKENSFLKHEVTDAISHATCTTAMDLNASAIITVTKSGKTARMISKYRPQCMIIGCSTQEAICRQMNLSWGVRPLLIEEKKEIEELFYHAADMAEKENLVKAGEIAVLTSGIPLGISGTSNLIKVHVIGHVLMKGRGIVNKSVSGKLCVCRNNKECQETFQKGDVLVIDETSNAIMKELKEASAVITQADGVNSHAAIVGFSLDIPVILGAKGAVSLLKSGVRVRVDGNTGQVSVDSDKNITEEL